MYKKMILLIAICVWNVSIQTGDAFPSLTHVTVDYEESSIISSSNAASSSSDASESQHTLTRARPTIFHLPAEILKNVLEYDIVRAPQDAGRLCAVHPTWNQCIQDYNFTLRILAHNPAYYAQHLKTAQCKELNNNKIPKQKILVTTEEYSVEEPSFSSSEEDSDDDEGSCANSFVCLCGIITIGTAGGGLVGFITGMIAQFAEKIPSATVYGVVGGAGAAFIISGIGVTCYLDARRTQQRRVQGGVRGNA